MAVLVAVTVKVSVACQPEAEGGIMVAAVNVAVVVVGKIEGIRADALLIHPQPGPAGFIDHPEGADHPPILSSTAASIMAGADDPKLLSNTGPGLPTGFFAESD